MGRGRGVADLRRRRRRSSTRSSPSSSRRTRTAASSRSRSTRRRASASTSWTCADAADRGRGRAARGERRGHQHVPASPASSRRQFRLRRADARALGRADAERAGDHRASSIRGCRRSPACRSRRAQANSLGIRGGGQGLQFAITGNDYDTLADKAVELQHALEDAPELRYRAAQLRHHAAGAFRPDRSRQGLRPRRIGRDARHDARHAARRQGARQILRRRRRHPGARAGAGRDDRRSGRPREHLRPHGGGAHGAALLLRHRDGESGRAGAAARRPAARRADQRHACKPASTFATRWTSLEALGAAASRLRTWASAISARRRR